MKQEEAKAIGTLVIVLFIIVVGAILVSKVFGGLNGLMEALGLKDNAQDKATAEAVNTAEKKGYFKSSFLNNMPKGALLVTQATANQRAKEIYDSVGVIYDSPENAKASFNKLKTKSQVAFVGRAFENLYKMDMLTYLETRFDRDSQKKVLAEIIEYCENLPKYTLNGKK